MLRRSLVLITTLLLGCSAENPSSTPADTVAFEADDSGDALGAGTVGVTIDDGGTTSDNEQGPDGDGAGTDDAADSDQADAPEGSQDGTSTDTVGPTSDAAAMGDSDLGLGTEDGFDHDAPDDGESSDATETSDGGAVGCTGATTKPCGTDEGQCVAGTQTCDAGQWGAREGGVAPTTESCSGLDEDCNGLTDDALTAPLAAVQDGVCAGAAKVCDGAGGWAEPDYTAHSQDFGDELCDGALDEDCDGAVDEDCTPPDPFDIGSCSGVAWTAEEALDVLDGQQRVLLASTVAKERACAGGVCGGPFWDWDIKFLAYSGGATTNCKYMMANMNLVLYNDNGVPRLSIQHKTFSSGGYPDDYDDGDGLIYGIPVGSPYSYPHLYAHDANPSGNNYSDLDLQVKFTTLTMGDGCLRWSAEPFAVALTNDWAMLFEW